MALRIDMPTFAGGEIGPELESRFDTAKYKTALRKGRDVIARVGGGVTSRPGLRYVGEVYDSEREHKLIPFQFSVSQAYALELGHQTLRVIHDGGYVLDPEIIITAATNTDPLVVTIPDSGYVVGDDVYFTGIEGMEELNNRLLRVTAVAGDDITFDVDATGWGAFTGSTGGVAGNAEGDVGGQPPPPDPVIDLPAPIYDFEDLPDGIFRPTLRPGQHLL